MRPVVMIVADFEACVVKECLTPGVSSCQHTCHSLHELALVYQLRVPDSTQPEPVAFAAAGIPLESWARAEPGKLSESWLKPSPSEALSGPST